MSVAAIVTILVDASESESPVLSRLATLGAHVKIGPLDTGNYVISGAMCLLHMNAHEFVEALLDGRLHHKAGKMSLSFQRSVFLIEGDIYSTRQPIAREAIDGALAFLACVEGASVIYVRNPIATGDLLYRLAKQAQKGQDFATSFQRIKVNTERQQALFTIESVFGVGPATAAKALLRFKSVFNFINAPVEHLTEIPGIGIKKAQRIYNSLRKEVGNESETAAAAQPTQIEH